MTCPVCGCKKFYLKDPKDEYETYGFELGDGGVAFDPEAVAAGCKDPGDTTETYCTRCSWHGSFGKLGKS